MSNAAVGQLYKRIIDQVIDASRTDFEENGVDNRMIATLQDKWQTLLTDKKAANYPWDPAPIQPEQQHTEKQAPNAKPQQSNGSSVTASPAPSQAQSQHQTSIPIKQEPGTTYDIAYNNYPTAGSNFAPGAGVAEQRAQQLVQSRYNNQTPGANFGNIQLPGQQQNGQQRPGYSYQNQPNGQQPRPAQVPNQPHIKQEPNPSQIDGAADEPGSSREQWSAVIAHRRRVENDDGPQGTHAADRMLRKHVARNLQRLEGGGLLVPLEERYGAQLAKSTGRESRKSKGPAASSKSSVPAQFDGGDEDDLKDDDDVDAINSDLDDSEDEATDAMVGEDYQGDMIICLYDKVQRVKNKWKCTLKDGVVNVDGKDYVFHKANGEFEW